MTKITPFYQYSFLYTFRNCVADFSDFFLHNILHFQILNNKIVNKKEFFSKNKSHTRPIFDNFLNLNN